MSGIFHSIKKSIGNKGDARPDLEFVDAKARFDQYQDTLIKLKGNISQDFSTLIEDPEREALNEYTDTSVSMRQEHQGLAHEQVPKLQHSFSTTLLSEIDAECVRNSELAKRVQRRIEVFSEMGYYQKKVNELREERSARANKGKTESASDIDKFERNQKKLAESEVMFHEINSKLLQDLRELWSVERIARMGPLLQRFLAHERKFAELYTQALAQVKDKTAFVTP